MQIVRECGVQCQCGRRGMIRRGFRVYLCANCDRTMYLMFSAATGFYTVPLATGLALEREKQLEVAR